MTTLQTLSLSQRTLGQQSLAPQTRKTLVLGSLVGLVAAGIGALYTVFARWGLAHGMQTWDLTFLRFAVAGVIMLPFLLHWTRAQSEIFIAKRKVWLGAALLAGPLFGVLMFGGLQFAPPSHAAVFPFTAMSVMGMLLSALVLRDKITPRKILGIAIVVTGLLILSGLNRQSLSARALMGDALFILAGTSWAGFGILLRKHQLSPLYATAVIAVFALFTYVPLYLWTRGLHMFVSVSISQILIQALVQGVIAGCGTLFTYGQMVKLLGPSRAAIFPALAPGFAVLIAWPVLSIIPTGHEMLGSALAMLGLIVAVTQWTPHFSRHAVVAQKV
jgi:drug/metabolite transporter (DMT)-like permease